MALGASQSRAEFERVLANHLRDLHVPLTEKLQELIHSLPPDIHALWFLCEPELISQNGFPVFVQGETPPDIDLPDQFDGVHLLTGVTPVELPQLKENPEDDDPLNEADRIILKLTGKTLWEAWQAAGGSELNFHAAFGDAYLVKEMDLRTGEWRAEE